MVAVYSVYYILIHHKFTSALASQKIVESNVTISLEGIFCSRIKNIGNGIVKICFSKTSICQLKPSF